MSTSLDSLHSLASSLAARWHELEDASRLALVEEIRRAAEALRQLARRSREDLGPDEESLEDSLIHEPLAFLTPRELEVLQAIADGESTRVIAAHLGITPLTVRSHVKSLLGKLGVHSRLEAVSVFLRLARPA
jgi:DNA-binding NarL/FixJ family response regulator